MEQPTKYDEFAKQYSTIFLEENAISTSRYHALFDNNLQGQKILDLGCGDGHDLNFFSQKGAICHGIDASTSMVDLAIANTNGKMDIHEAYFEKLPYPNEYFDIVGSKYALQASSDIERIYQETNRVLKPGGTFIFLVGHPIYQFMEKRKHPKDYFLKEMIHVKIFNGRIPITEPTHTIAEFLSPYFLKHFDLQTYIEEAESSIDKVDGDTYPAFLLIKAKKRLL